MSALGPRQPTDHCICSGVNVGEAELHADNQPVSVGTTNNSVSTSGAVLLNLNRLIESMSHVLQQTASVALLAISVVLLLWIVFS
jgi:hypothetical protein